MTITPEKKEPGKVESAPLQPSVPEAPAPRRLFSPYKEDQGRHVRMAAFWSIVFFLGFGCRFLHDLMIQWVSLREPLGGIRIPVVSVNLSPAFLVSALVFLAGGCFLVLSDVVARTVVRPLELPVGVITALVGVPVFALLLRRTLA